MNSQPRTLVVRAGTTSRRALRLGRGSWESLVGDRIATGEIDVRRVTIEPGSVPGPLHLHRSNENTFVVLEGEVDVNAGSERHRLTAGEAILIPAGIPHATNNPSDRVTVLLAVYDGPIADDYHPVGDRPPRTE